MKAHGLMVCAVAWAWCAGAWADTVIVVDFGAHASAQAAASSEAKVNWLDADTSDDTACTESFAAVELQKYLRLLTGRKTDFAIVRSGNTVTVSGGDVIALGSLADRTPSQREKVADHYGVKRAELVALGPQEYRIKTIPLGRTGNRLTGIIGGGRAGTLYGAYDLLHHLGVRWFAPGALHEDVPAGKLARPGDFDITGRPSFLTRGFHAWQDRGGQAFLLWMARNRLNYWCVEESNHALVRKLGIRMSCGAHFAEKRFLDPYREYPYNHAKFAGDDRKGKPADPYKPSALYQGDANTDGTLSYFEAHPDWYAQVGPKRVPGIRGEFGTNFCTSNADACTEFFKNYVQCLVDGRWKDADVVRFWTLDGGTWCQCPACRALGTPTDRNLRLVYQLDKAIKAARAAGRIHRPLIIRFLAYHDVLTPPTKPLPKDFDYATCSATFFPIVRSYVYDFLDKRSPRNARYHQQLLGWASDPQRHYRGALCIGEYYNVSGYKGLPICFMHTMARDIPTYYRFGARHFHYMHVVTDNLGTRALTNYQMARQLWDVTTDCETLWQDYFLCRYGPAARTMRAFYDALEPMLCNVTELKYTLPGRLVAGRKPLFPSPQLRYARAKGVACNGPTLMDSIASARTCRERLSRALSEAGAKGVPRKFADRIAEDERLFTYGERTLQYYRACAEAYLALDAKDLPAARKHLARAESLADLLKSDTTSTKYSSAHANAANALEASRAGGALATIRKRLAAASK